MHKSGILPAGATFAGGGASKKRNACALGGEKRHFGLNSVLFGENALPVRRFRDNMGAYQNAGGSPQEHKEE